MYGNAQKARGFDGKPGRQTINFKMKGMMTMRTILKRAVAAMLALALCAGLAGCYSEDKAWAAKAGDNTLPIGGYIYYLTSAYTDAAGKVGTEQAVFGSQIEGKDAKAWVEDRALSYLRSYYYVSQKFDELGLTLDEDDQASINSMATSMWGYYKSAFEGLGVAESSFKETYAVYNTKLAKLLPALYGKGGELEVSEDDLKAYYLDNYTYYQYFSIPLTKAGEDDTAVDMEEDEKKEVREMLDDTVELINDGRLDFDKAVEKHKTLSSEEPTVGEPMAMGNSSMSTLFSDALFPLKNEEAAVIDATSRYYVVQKLDITQDFEALLADEERMDSLLRAMKGDDFLAYTMEQGAGLDVTINAKAIAGVKTTAIADVMGKNGTSSAEEDTASSSTSSTSSEGSSSEG